MEIRQFKVEGMTCAACSARVERAVSSLEGVEECSVNLLLGCLTVRGSTADSEIIFAVERAGYKAARDKSDDSSVKDEAEFDSGKAERRKIAKRLSLSASLLALLVYISMGHNMWGAPLPAFLENSPHILGLLQLVISGIILVINKHFFVNGMKGAVRLAPNMDSLVAIGSGASFIYSVCLLVLIAERFFEGDATGAMELLHGLYFEAAAMIPVLINVGKLLEAFAKGRTTDAIKELMLLAPKQVTVERGGIEEIISVDSLNVGDVMIIRQGESISADGIVIFGDGSVNESMLTGESMPVDKASGAEIFCGTILVSGYIKARAVKIGENTVLSDIVKTVKEASSGKAPVAKIADRVSGIFVPAVMAIALLTAVIWLILGEEIGYALSRGTAVLVISCPCALGLATPVAVMVGSGVGARQGILFKTAASIELSGRVKSVVFDKTGTITEGKPSVNGIYSAEAEESEIISKAYSLEKMSEHPLAKAIVAYAEEHNAKGYDADGFLAEAGGISGIIGGKAIFCGNYRFTCEKLGKELPKELKDTIDSLSEKGNTPLILCEEKNILGVISLADRVKPESRFAIHELKRLGIKTLMLTGDNKSCAESIASDVGIDGYRAEVYPKDKALIVKELSEKGAVCMVGDGINDAPALTAADVGMAIGAGAHIAIDSAEVVLVGGKLTSALDAIRLGRRTLGTIYLNLFWAFCYNIVGIPLAAGSFSGLLGWSLSPMFGALAMSLSSFLVVSSSLSINFFKSSIKKSVTKENANNGLNKPFKNEKIKETVNDIDCQTGKEKCEMEKQVTIKIEGMMCPHCSGRVKAALEGTVGVLAADVSHERGDAIITVSSGCDVSALEKCITDAGYKVIG